METNKQFTVFAGFEQLATGDLKTVLTHTWEYLDQGGQAQLLIFDDETGRQIDFNLQGTLQEVWERNLPDSPRPGPGRPKLGVTSREISLLPRHWEWLDQQPTSASGTIRRLVETARKNPGNGNKVKQRMEAAGKFMWALAGNLEGFEETSRALYAGQWETFRELTAGWPRDIKEYLERLLQGINKPVEPGL